MLVDCLNLVLSVLFLLLVASTQGAWSAAFYVSALGSPGSLGTAGMSNTTNTFGADSATSWTSSGT